jgi:transcriptional regulator with XRE-family HTH domain
MAAPSQPHGHGGVAFVPGIRVALKCLKTKDLPQVPRTLGEHLKRRRRVLGLLQRQVADQLGVSQWTVINWEQGVTTPVVAHLPSVIAFLGYDPAPSPVPTTLGERLRARRIQCGLSIKQAAREFGVDEASWAGWERTGNIVQERHRLLIEQFLGQGVE